MDSPRGPSDSYAVPYYRRSVEHAGRHGASHRRPSSLAFDWADTIAGAVWPPNLTLCFTDAMIAAIDDPIAHADGDSAGWRETAHPTTPPAPADSGR